MIKPPPSTSRAAFLAWAREQIDTATPLIDVDRFDEAHDRFMAIAQHFQADDPSPEAGLVWKHLGMTWRDRSAGLKHENLLLSKDMLERARTHRARRTEPWRLALTRAQLAVTLRQLMAFQPARAPALARRAEKLFRAAIKRLDHMVRTAPKAVRHGVLVYLGEARNNLANLYATLERPDEALVELRRAQSVIERESAPPAGALALVPQIRLNRVNALVMRDRPGDVDDARRQIRHVLRCDNPRLLSQARLLGAQLARRVGDDDEARTLLAEIEAGYLGPEGEFVVLRLLRELSSHGRALALAQAFIRRVAKRRAGTLATGNVDQESRHIQLLTAEVARIHAADDKPVDAFLALEGHAAQRFDETVRDSQVEHVDRVSYELISMCMAADDCAISLEEALGDMSLGLATGRVDAVPALQAFLQRYLTGPQQARLAGHQCQAIRDEAVQRIDEALAGSDPAAGLLAVCRRFVAEGERLRAAAMRYDPDLKRQWYLPRVMRTHLEAIAAERRGEVFIRLSALLDDILVVAVWHDETGLQARHLTLPYPANDQEVVRALHADVDSAGDGRAARVFERLDISGVFPATRGGTAVFLPSRLAAGLPLAALGPRGRTPLDHFDAVRVMPNLKVFLIPPATHEPRVGSRAFIGPDTLLGEEAFADALPDERIDAEPADAMNALGAALATADVVSIYAHGRHKQGRPPAVCLDGATWWPEPGHGIASDLRGMERVEVWACRSGSTRSNDRRSPDLVDEVTGLDGVCLEMGARSTLGALLPVREGVAAAIARVYRQGIAGGAPADRALADAQRWWRDGPLAGLDADDDALLDGLSGDGETPSDDAQRERLRAALRCPSAWAVFRIMGVCERRPTAPMPFDPGRALTEEEQARLNAALAEDGPATASPGADDAAAAIEALLTSAESAALAGPTTCEIALSLASILKARLVADAQHNLARALAWVHDALATPRLPADDRRRLLECAVHLWLDLAIELAGHFGLTSRSMRALLVFQRVRRLLADLPDDALSSARAMLHSARVPLGEADDPRLGEAIALLGAIDRLPIGEIEHAAEVIARAAEHPAADEAGRALIARTQLLGERLREGLDARRLDVLFGWHRTAAAVANMARLLDLDELAFSVEVDYLPAGPRWRSTLMSTRDLTVDLGEAIQGRIDDGTIAFLNTREDHVWGRMGRVDQDRWRGSGGHGFHWWNATSAVIESALAQAHDPRVRAPHLMASCHLGADLRTQQLNRWMVVQSSPLMRALGDRDPTRLIPCDSRELCLDLLTESALASADPVDPFSQSPAALRSAHTGNGALEWDAAHVADVFEDASVKHGRTVAGRLARAVASIDAYIADHWPRMLELDAQTLRGRLSEASAPAQELNALQAAVISAPAETAHVMLGRTRTGGLFAGLVHRQVCRLVKTDAAPSDPDLMALFMGLGRPMDLPVDMPSVEAAWARVAANIAGFVRPMVELALEAGACHLRILAPGALRMVPWIGLPIGAGVLGDVVAARGGSVVHLPALDWWSPPEGASPPDGVDGTLSHPGLASAESIIDVVATLGGGRRLDPEGGISPHRTELDRLAYEETPVVRLRLVGEGGGRSGQSHDNVVRAAPENLITAFDVARLRFQGGAEAEFWSATAARLPEDWSMPTRDRLPGFVRAALRSGASGALDLAWEIEPLVKALLCEQFGLLTRYHRLRGGIATAGAAQRVRALFDGLPEGAGGRWRDTVDERRAIHWRAAVGAEVPMARLGSDATRPDGIDWQLAAVRWWGV